MIIEQIYTGCLAEAAYYIESEGEALIIDPLRDTSAYEKKAESNGAKIKYVLETHFHADFVSGHLTLAKKTGAEIIFGPNAVTDYKMRVARDGEILKLGKIQIKVLHTPGHTMESTCYLLLDENQKEHAVFTGDTLFIGDVGRPDLAVKSDLTQTDLAKNLFHSLRTKIMTLPSDVIIYPGHGAGSACGKNLSSKRFATLENQLRENYALKASMTEAEFVKEVTEGLLPPPQYFPINVQLNKEGYEDIDEVIAKGLNPLNSDDFEKTKKTHNALILDTRNPQEFKKGFIPTSINIGLNGQFAPWVGALITDLNQPILLVTEVGKEQESITRLSRVGYDNVLGFLEGGLGHWKNSSKTIDTISSISAEQLSKDIDSDIYILDVRKEPEYESQHINKLNVENFPLDTLNQNIENIEPSRTYYIHCAGGYRSSIAASILKARGFNNLIDIEGGFNAIKETSISISNYVCPSTL